uniref:Uncharacterized protein n=1 Tax=uncultured bacterium esnapd13 TaxID=1366593 RepID=S5TUL8_9BACT|nr:hypothetical protein [uncultured bacterium esnapd13]
MTSWPATLTMSATARPYSVGLSSNVGHRSKTTGRHWVHARRALELYRGLDLPMWEARALNGVGWCAAQLGDYDTPREHCQAAGTTE